MKQLKMMIAVSVLALSALIGEVAKADGPNGKCYIHVTRPCHNNLGYHPALGWYQDGDPMAQNNAARCAQRAVEWFNYCSDPFGNQVVYSAYNTFLRSGGEATVLYSVKHKGGSAITGPGSAGYFGVIGTNQ
ncbi:MAG: hypothetical protein KF767_18165 [Bdellovibrionaceae bacterium]|nr:hypothetical protein [Pseudobdellovibrionaceae bacterium]